MRRYKNQGETENDDIETSSKDETCLDDYVKVGYLFPKDRLQFRGVAVWNTILTDLMKSVREADPHAVFIVFDTCASPGDAMKASIDASVVNGELCPLVGTFFAGIEPDARMIGYVTPWGVDGHNVSEWTVFAFSGV
jgi:hypothetical protein